MKLGTLLILCAGMALIGANAANNSYNFGQAITVSNTRTVGSPTQGSAYGITLNNTTSGTGHDYLSWGVYGNMVNNAAALPCSSSGTCGVGFIEPVVGRIVNNGTAHELDGVSSYSIQTNPASHANWVKAFNANLQISAGKWISAYLFGVTHLEVAPGTVTNLTGIALPNITGGMNNWAIKTGLGKVEFGDTVQAQGFKAGDGSPGFTGSICTSFKNGLCVNGN